MLNCVISMSFQCKKPGQVLQGAEHKDLHQSRVQVRTRLSHIIQQTVTMLSGTSQNVPKSWGLK